VTLDKLNGATHAENSRTAISVVGNDVAKKGIGAASIVLDSLLPAIHPKTNNLINRLSIWVGGLFFLNYNR
jgi:hypothetical protein